MDPFKGDSVKRKSKSPEFPKWAPAKLIAIRDVWSARIGTESGPGVHDGVVVHYSPDLAERVQVLDKLLTHPDMQKTWKRHVGREWDVAVAVEVAVRFPPATDTMTKRERDAEHKALLSGLRELSYLLSKHRGAIRNILDYFNETELNGLQLAMHGCIGTEAEIMELPPLPEMLTRRPWVMAPRIGELLARLADDVEQRAPLLDGVVSRPGQENSVCLAMVRRLDMERLWNGKRLLSRGDIANIASAVFSDTMESITKERVREMLKQ